VFPDDLQAAPRLLDTSELADDIADYIIERAARLA
jgi:hypothetical protein